MISTKSISTNSERSTKRFKQDDVGFSSYLYAWNATFLRVKQGGMETTNFMDG